MTINLDDYRGTLALDLPWQAAAPTAVDDATAAKLAGYFATEACLRPDDAPPLHLLRALLTRRAPDPVPPDVQARLDALLAEQQAGVTHTADLPTVADRCPGSAYPAAEQTSLWRGDITRLGADAIVNAANAQMLGCFIPFHACIDNAIHWAAGPRLRADCNSIMRCQGHDEPTGTAKATRAYNLPSRFVLHTVGPIVRGPLTAAHAAALASSYRACLDLAAELSGVRTLAFCAISTGVFGYPKRDAARVALDTVASWLAEPGHAALRVVFNVFSAKDERVYLEALEGRS